VVATLLGVVQNYPGYLASRFFLGVAESGLFPGVVFYLSMWYKRNEQHYRVALFFSAASLAGAFGGILAWGIAHMEGVGGYKGWRWIFILVWSIQKVASLFDQLLMHFSNPGRTFDHCCVGDCLLLGPQLPSNGQVPD
jgi:MFS family permease